MGWIQAAGWGLAGGLAAGLVSLMNAVTGGGFRWPWKDRSELWPRVFVLAGSVLVGAVVAAAAHSQISGPWPAFILGAGAPATVRGILGGVEVSDRKSAELDKTRGAAEGGEDGEGTG